MNFNREILYDNQSVFAYTDFHSNSRIALNVSKDRSVATLNSLMENLCSQLIVILIFRLNSLPFDWIN